MGGWGVLLTPPRYRPSLMWRQSFQIIDFHSKMRDWHLPSPHLEILSITRVFSKCTRMAIMPILASEALFRENKKILLQNATLVSIEPERSQNTILLASTQAVYKAPHSTVRGHYYYYWSRSSSDSSSRKSESIRLEHIAH